MGLLTACAGGQLDPRPDISSRFCLGFEIRVGRGLLSTLCRKTLIGREEEVQVMRKLCLQALV